MDADEIAVVFRGPAARVLRSIAAQSGRSVEVEAEEAVRNHHFFFEGLWAGKVYRASDDGWATYSEVVFPFQPPRLPPRKPPFMDWLPSRWWYPVLAGVIMVWSCLWAATVVTSPSGRQAANAIEGFTVLVQYMALGEAALFVVLVVVGRNLLTKPGGDKTRETRE